MTNGEKSVIGSALDMGNKIVAALPPTFLLLVLINAVFIVAMLWFIDHQMEQRLTLANRILEHCLQKEK